MPGAVLVAGLGYDTVYKGEQNKFGSFPCEAYSPVGDKRVKI